jgi:signal transduction histidine kinase
VQESITNVLRHANASHAAVELRYGNDELLLRVTDNGCGGRTDGDGFGIRGMGERVAILGGDLRAGPENGHGFVVEARLPLVDFA